MGGPSEAIDESRVVERRLRVVYIVRYLPSTSETFILDEAKALAAAGAEVLVYALDGDESAVRHARHEDIYAAAQIVPRSSSPRAIWSHALMSESPAFAGVRASWKGRGRQKDLRRVAWLARSWRRQRVDVVRVHHAAETARFAVAACGVADLPISIAVHARDLFVPVPDLSWLLRSASLVTTITPHHRDLLLRSGLPSQLVVLLRCPVGLPAELAEAPEAGSPLRLVSVGRLVAKKGHDLLIRACARLAAEGTPIDLVIVGEGNERPVLTEQISEVISRFGDLLNISLEGGMPSEAVSSLLAEGRFHAAVLACRVTEEGDRDGVPVALMEAQSYGVPIVTSALPGFEYEFTDGAGAVLVSMQESDSDAAIDPALPEMIRALAELYRDPRYRQRMADGARFTSGLRPTPDDIGHSLLEMLLPLCSTIAEP